MNAAQANQWQSTFIKTQQYLRNRILGNGCERDQIEAWRNFYRTNDPIVRWMVVKSGLCGKDKDCVEAVWLDVIANLNTLRSPQTYDSFLFWLKRLVHATAQQRRLAMGANSRVQGADEQKSEFPTSVEQLTTDEQRIASADLNDRLLHLRLVEAQPVDRVARTLGLTCQQVLERQQGILKRILSILIRLDIAPVRS